ncbi:MAG TPA: acyltransferase [Rhizomicrobium sp.]|nr:acyltransferase [Rhizomicrobium sp.]
MTKPAEIRALAGARAFPPLVLVMFHFSEGHGYRNFWPLDLLAARGYLWVEFFFCLSGFILTHVYGPRLAKLLTREGYGQFLKARLTRLYPLHLFMLLAVLAMVIVTRILAHIGGYHSIFDLRYHQDVSVKGFFLSLFLVHGWNTMDRLTWNGVSWFVSVEWALCLMFPMLLWLANGRTWRGLALIAAGVAGLTALDLISGAHVGLDITYHDGVLRGLADFAMGVGFAVLYRAWKPHDRLPDWAHSLIQLAVFATLLCGIYDTGWSHTVMDIWTALPMMTLVLALSFDRGLFADALKTRIPQVLGRWSYAVYIGQTFWLLVIRVFEQRLYPAPMTPVLGTTFISLSWWLEPLSLVVACTVWGGLLERFVEHPAATWFKGKSRLDHAVAATPS